MPQSNPTAVEGTWNGVPARFRPDQLIVSVTDLAKKYVLDTVVTRASNFLHRQVAIFSPPAQPWAILRFDPPSHPEDAIPGLARKLIAEVAGLEYAEPDFEGKGNVSPNDPLYANQTWTDVVKLESAWQTTDGTTDVLIAVLDSGISISAGQMDPDHPELSGQRFIVRHTIADKDGRRNVFHDYVDNDDVPQDAHGHGTHVTGIIAAASNNGIGIAGINSGSNIYVARVLDAFNVTFVGRVKTAMEDLRNYADANGISRIVVNLSLGFQNAGSSIEQVCKDTHNGKFLLCVGPGSEAKGSGLDYPGAYADNYDHVIAVGAVNGNDITAPQADPSNLTLCAPGWRIVSVAPTYACTLWDPLHDPSYPTLSGTSQAAAIMSGIASLIWSAYPNHTPAQVRGHLVKTADPFSHNRKSGKRVNGASAMVWP
jgi:subtilisin family serine protease